MPQFEGDGPEYYGDNEVEDLEARAQVRAERIDKKVGREFLFREVVRVERTSGEIEEDWVVMGVDKSDPSKVMVIVEKPTVIDGERKIQHKEIPASKLELLNP